MSVKWKDIEKLVQTSGTQPATFITKPLCIKKKAKKIWQFNTKIDCNGKDLNTHEKNTSTEAQLNEEEQATKVPHKLWAPLWTIVLVLDEWICEAISRATLKTCRWRNVERTQLIDNDKYNRNGDKLCARVFLGKMSSSKTRRERVHG